MGRIALTITLTLGAFGLLGTLGLPGIGCSSPSTGGDPPPPVRGMRLPPRSRPPASTPVGPRTEPMAAPRAEPARPATPPAPATLPPTELERVRTALLANPADHPTRERFARLLVAKGDLPAAQAELEVLLKVPAHAQAARVLRCRIHRSVNEVDAAVRWGRLAVQHGPKDPDARLQLGLSLLAANERGAATTHLEEGIKLAPKRADLRIALGDVALRRHKAREAVAAFREAARLAPTDPAPVTRLGDAYWALSLHGKAERAYRRALNMTTGAPIYRAMALDKLGVLYYQRGFRQKAERVLEACRRLFPHLGCPYTRVALLPANPIKVPGAAPVRRY